MARDFSLPSGHGYRAPGNGGRAYPQQAMAPAQGSASASPVQATGVVAWVDRTGGALRTENGDKEVVFSEGVLKNAFLGQHLVG